MVGFWSLLASAFLVSVFGFLLPLTSLHSDDRDVWLAVASLLWVGRFAIAFPAASRGRESSRERSFMVPRDTPGRIDPPSSCKWEVTVVNLPCCATSHYLGGEVTIKYGSLYLGIIYMKYSIIKFMVERIYIKILSSSLILVCNYKR